MALAHNQQRGGETAASSQAAPTGNISIDSTRYPDVRATRLIGGAALHTAAAAHRASLSAALVFVICGDLAHLPADARLTGLDCSCVAIVDGPSAQFGIDYDSSGRVSSLTACHGVADGLTEQGLARISAHMADSVHVCCRRPLDVAAVLSALVRLRKAVLQTKYREANRRLLHTERAGQGCVLASPASERVASPTVEDGGARVSALRFGDPRVRTWSASWSPASTSSPTRTFAPWCPHCWPNPVTPPAA